MEILYLVKTIKLLNTITPSFFINNTAIVMNNPKTEFELNYIENIKKWFNDNNISINIESIDIVTDFHIMKNAKKLICSNSTISWCAALLSDNIETTCLIIKLEMIDLTKHLNIL